MDEVPVLRRVHLPQAAETDARRQRSATSWLPVRQRLEQLLDDGSWEELSGEIEPLDVLGFADSKPYAERFADAQRKTGHREGAIYGTGTIGGRPVVLAAMNFAFIGGSMGSGVGEAVTRAAELALGSARRSSSSRPRGARMQEGRISLMQMAKTSQAIGRTRRGSSKSSC